MSKSTIQRRSAILTKDLTVNKQAGQEISFPTGTVFYNYRPNSKSEWDVWFYEYETSGGLGLQLSQDEFTTS